MSTIRPSWPSADLWKRVQSADGLSDESVCPTCGCPAITHFRDALIGALFCPVVTSDAERAKLWAMVQLTSKYARAPLAGRSFLPLQGNPPVEATTLAKEVTAQIETARNSCPDFDELRPWLVQIIGRSPGISFEDAVPVARAARDMRAARVQEEADATRREIRALALRQKARATKLAEREARQAKLRAAKMSPVQPRRYDLED